MSPADSVVTDPLGGPFAVAFFLVAVLPIVLFLRERGLRRQVEAMLQLSLGLSGRPNSGRSV
ncbi:hypothetical protein TVNIR_1399 [Thioalkalivibrio nitratireducens DSM 14787]|uniref:Uncharacterized protein n=1 Tax=Thioalkalivibrio nitratireducens (strain DSM 14787 / UNIQEM 213 / ALEN2) TaxID=1255043 RepID=L0DVR2_THIND|nr:hypothetical protein TVNIR_1399 [Thioalkalivibrio nitratireducens DSM 14787]